MNFPDAVTVGVGDIVRTDETEDLSVVYAVHPADHPVQIGTLLRDSEGRYNGIDLPHYFKGANLDVIGSLALSEVLDGMNQGWPEERKAVDDWAFRWNLVLSRQLEKGPVRVTNKPD